MNAEALNSVKCCKLCRNISVDTTSVSGPAPLRFILFFIKAQKTNGLARKKRLARGGSSLTAPKL
jgi:hypothetical protein